MSKKVYPCRKETISGTKYLVEIIGADGAVRLRTSCQTQEEADQVCAALVKVNQTLTSKVTPKNWTMEVCIECGEER